jgi:2-dehydro-3-deoxyphosphogluconate aldolase/(4S)-4-hydroxy-2-oxoglutarate aldolase
MTPQPTDGDTTRAPQPSWAGFFAEHLGPVPLVAILRGLDPDSAVGAARAAWGCGVPLVEVTLERPEGIAALSAVVAAAPDGVPVGAGTVTTPERLARAAGAGARFGVAPGLDEDTVRAAAHHEMPFLPGIATPTEAGHALRLGVTTVKAFPAGMLGTSWVRALADPFPELQVVATGGLDADNAPGFLAAGALAVGLGSALRGPGLHATVEAVRRSAR